MAFETISPEKSNVVSIHEDYAVNVCYVADVACPKGTVVKLLSNGKVTPVTATTDVPFGVVVVPSRAADKEVTVLTNFCAIVDAQAHAAITRGGLVASSGLDGTTKKIKFKASAAGDYIYGIALNTAAAAGDAVQVGVLRSPIKI